MSKTSKTIDVDGMVVTAIVSTKTSKSAEPIVMTWELHYKDVDSASLLAKASANDIITLQNRYRTKPFEQTRFDIAVDLKERPRLTAVDKARRQVAQMSDEDKAALLASLTAELEGETQVIG